MDPHEWVEVGLASRIGLDAASIGRDEVRRLVRFRMRELHVPTEAAYLTVLDRSEDEWDELVEGALVPETWFHREPPAFDWLQGVARREWLQAPTRDWRILSLPAATGEEPYSIVMTLAATGWPLDRIHVTAVDISRRAIDAGRRGVYGKRALRAGVPDAWADYFTPAADGHGAEVIAAVRARVEYRRGNLIDPLLLSGAGAFDVVFCRNALIYLHEDARARVRSTLRRLVKPDGALLTGFAEPSMLWLPEFESAGQSGVALYRPATDDQRQASVRLAATRPLATRSPRRSTARPDSPAAKTKSWSGPSASRAARSAPTAATDTRPGVDEVQSALHGSGGAGRRRTAGRRTRPRRPVGGSPSEERRGASMAGHDRVGGRAHRRGGGGVEACRLSRSA